MLKDNQALALYGAALFLTAALTPTLALAYVGPGLGLGAIASFFSIIGAVFLAIVGFVWYPVKRVLRMFRRPKDVG
jgi:hypothetical protein